MVSKEVVVSNQIRNSMAPDLRPVISREDHDYAADDEAFGWSVEHSEVQRVRVVRLPRREEHWQAGDQRGEDPGLGRTQTHSCGLEQACEGAVEGIDAMVKELSETTGGASPACLFAVHIVHGRVHPQAKGKTIVQPGRALAGDGSVGPALIGQSETYRSY